jgi:flagellar hook protein FlgE
MMRGMYSAVSGLKSHQTMLDVTANDLANVNTVGYKSARTTFADSLTQLQRSGAQSSAGTGGANAAQIGLGVRLGSIDNIMSGGAFQSTGNALDVGIQGEGWFRVGPGVPTAGNPQAGAVTNVEYTRAGNFRTNDRGYMTTADGLYVVGRNATAAGPGNTDQYLFVPPGASDVAVSPDGALSFVAPDGYVAQPGQVAQNGRVVAGYVSLAKFPNEGGLERSTNNRWRAGAATGAAEVGTSGGVFGATIGGTLEMSNVDMATQFTQMIAAQRGFQASSRVISTSDEMLRDLVNLNR